MKMTAAQAMTAMDKYQQQRDQATDILSRKVAEFLCSWAAWHFERAQLGMANRSGNAGLRGAAMKRVNVAAQRMATKWVGLKTTQAFMGSNIRVPLVTDLAA